jgi:hypothetical protein
MTSTTAATTAVGACCEAPNGADFEVQGAELVDVQHGDVPYLGFFEAGRVAKVRGRYARAWVSGRTCRRGDLIGDGDPCDRLPPEAAAARAQS